jgi:hypothetical protein
MMNTNSELPQGSAPGFSTLAIFLFALRVRALARACAAIWTSARLAAAIISVVLLIRAGGGF